MQTINLLFCISRAYFTVADFLGMEPERVGDRRYEMTEPVFVDV
jgi:hypothetical protein